MAGAILSASPFQRSLDRLRHATGIVIPVYFPSGVDPSEGATLLHDTVVACCDQVADPTVICLSVDGAANGVDIASKLAEAHGTELAVAPVNRGKLQGARAGVSKLLEKAGLSYIAVLDSDGDHFANELLNFVRAADQIVTETGDPRVMILGRRISRHRPMGLLRGELEWLADRLLLNALEYHAARVGHPLKFEYATMLDDVPDFHSGYKLFTRPTAIAVFEGAPNLAGVSEVTYYRHAVEAVMVVEALLSGARLGVINRSTFNEQPVTAFGLLDRARLTADMIVWPCKRLGVPAHFVRQWMENALPAMLLGTLVPEGRQELCAVYEAVLEAFDLNSKGADPFAKRPLFV
ncbi:MAG: hypothetical protein ACP5HG_00715 [Anaerolineae bacterium]